jgi:hypothetical protein
MPKSTVVVWGLRRGHAHPLDTSAAVDIMCAPRSDARDTSDGFSRTAHNTTIRSRPATPYATQILKVTKRCFRRDFIFRYRVVKYASRRVSVQYLGLNEQ